MNDRAREVLAAAALRGHRQIRGLTHDYSSHEGECGLGVLHLALHDTRPQALQCNIIVRTVELARMYDISQSEMTEFVRRNDDEGWDFLMLARKVGTEADHVTP